MNKPKVFNVKETKTEETKDAAVSKTEASISHEKQTVQQENSVQIGFEEVVAEQAREKQESSERETITDAEQKVSQLKSKKKKIMNLCFLLLNIVIVTIILVTQIKSDNMMPLSEVLSYGFHPWILLLCFFAFGLMSVFEGMKINILVKKSSGRSRRFLSYKTAAIGRYYDCVTPMSTGGQPFQIFYLKNRGLRAADSISVVLGKYVFFQISFVVLTTVVIIASLFINKGGTGGQLVGVASWIGYFLNFSLIFLILLFSISRKIGNGLVTGLLKLGKKMRIVKDYDKTFKSVMKTVDDFQGTMKYYAKSPKIFFISLLLAFSTLLINYTFPYLIYSTFYGFGIGNWGEIFVMCVMIDLASGFVPLPGGTGMAELSFTALFGALFAGGRLFWALILWRVLTYYGYILQGLVIIVYDYFFGNKKYYWQKKKWELEDESNQFKTEQLKYFKKKSKNNK